MAHVFITGGTGFLGTQIIMQLTQQGHQVTALVRSPHRLAVLHEQLEREHALSVSAVIGDLTLPGLGLSAEGLLSLHQADIMIHAGGPMDIMLSEQQAKSAFLDAAGYISELAAALYKNGKLKHFIHVVGFKSPVTNENIDQPDAIMKLLEHESPYERMKIMADVHIRQQAKASGYPLSIVNPSVVIGDSITGSTEQTGGLGILVSSSRRKLMGTVPGGGKFWIPLVHIDHTAKFIAALVREHQPENETYYLLDEQMKSPSMTELIRIINKELRVPAPIGFIPLSILKKLLNTPLGRKLGIPQQSLSFIVDSAFPIESTKTIQRKYELPASIEASVLPHVIADLDYRLSHRNTDLSGFIRGRRGPLATLEKKGSGNPILILPGTFSGADCLLPLASELHGRQVWIADLPGLGRTPYHHSKDVVEGHVHSIITAIAEQETSVTLIGHSYGGLLAAKVMERIPKHIQSVYLLQPALHKANVHHRLPSLNRLILSKLSPSVLRNTLIRQGCFDNDEQIPASYMEYVLAELSSPRIRATLADTMAALTKARTFQLQPSSWSAVPTTILWGELDRNFSLPQAYNKLPLERVARGHHFPISHPAQTAQLLLQAGL
ncbi:alpha/beta fold hydrolase [Paenibacillus sinopodophylli]|uniref:alpha/beta fold hydrolase n=1 Tax=Paenibacillus sinopodophylli TaxID=1837342 RepID=UPI00110D1BE1|nr:alpha/beta fold hydrolase [Paenibacillus sinopodophylli]